MDPDFVTDMTAYVETWHGVTPPNALATRLLADLAKVIADFEALRGTLEFEDEPASFEAALVEASTAGLPA